MIGPNVQFCNMMLRTTRDEAKTANVSVPKNLSTYCIEMGNSKWYEVYSDEKPGILWAGYCSCAAEAKTKYISDLVDNGVELTEEQTGGDPFK